MNAEVIGESSRITRRKCITRLHQCLADQGIIVYPNGDKDISDKPRGCVYLLRFIPQETIFELQPGFPKYFQVARRYDLLSHQEADALVRRLAALGSTLRDKYHGRLSKYLRTGVIGEFLDSASDTRTLSLLEATEDWFPDLLHEQLHWPCDVDAYLMPSEFIDLRLDHEGFATLAGNPIRALIAGLVTVRAGHWLGLSTNEINAILELLGKDSGVEFDDRANLKTERYAEKIVVPIYSMGFQGSIIGVFSKLERRQKMRLRSTLNDAAQCLGEQYALERKSQLRDLLTRNEINAKILAQAVIQIASPVEHIAVSHAGEFHAYTICREQDYLVGYEQRTGDAAEELKHDPNNELLDLRILDQQVQIYIKLLHGYAAFDPAIYGLRVKIALSEFLASMIIENMAGFPRKASDNIAALGTSDLDRVIMALRHQMNAHHGRRIAAKHLCFFEIVKEEFQSREARLTNAEMQKRISAKLNGEKVNGYQVTGDALQKFSLEIDTILPKRFLFDHLNDKVIRVHWR